MDLDKVCLPCRIMMHDECELSWDETLPDEQDCCCGGRYTLRDHWKQLVAEDQDVDSDGYAAPSLPAPSGDRKRGKSGYIAAAAWPGNADIGTLADPSSTGRKRAADMYPITPGQVCEWARQKNCGGGVEPIVGCLGNPASDIHHGPDKNTLNNEKVSRGVGDSENLHLICSPCHNSYHAKNDMYYPEYDRVEQQAEPWLPSQSWTVHEPEPATFEELVEAERLRDAIIKKLGKETRGRNSAPRASGDFSVRDESRFVDDGGYAASEPMHTD